MSGIDTRSGFRNRSNSRSNRSGSTSVMPRAYATREPAAEPRPGPTGIPRSRAAAMKSCDDEEVAGVAGLVDDAELVGRAAARTVRGQRVAVAPRRRPRGPDRSSSDSSVAYLGGTREAGQEVPLLEVELAEVGHASAVFASASGWSGKSDRISALGLHVRFLAGEAEPLGIVEIGAGADGEQHVVRLRRPRAGDSGRRWWPRRRGRAPAPSWSMPSVTSRSSGMPCSWISSQNRPGRRSARTTPRSSWPPRTGPAGARARPRRRDRPPGRRCPRSIPPAPPCRCAAGGRNPRCIRSSSAGSGSGSRCGSAPGGRDGCTLPGPSSASRWACRGPKAR